MGLALIICSTGGDVRPTVVLRRALREAGHTVELIERLAAAQAALDVGSWRQFFVSVT